MDVHVLSVQMDLWLRNRLRLLSDAIHFEMLSTPPSQQMAVLRQNPNHPATFMNMLHQQYQCIFFIFKF